MKFLESPENPKFKIWKSLLQSRGIKKEGLFLVFGPKLVQEVIERHPQSCVSLILSPRSKEAPREYRFLPGQVIKFVLRNDMYKELDVLGTQDDILVCELPTLPRWDGSQPPEGLELLVPLGDPSNLGAVLRSAQAFQCSRIVILSESAHPFHPKAIRAAASGLLSLPLAWGPSLRQTPEIRDCWALDSDGQSLRSFQWPKNIRLLVGEEGQGIPESFPRNRRISIPMAPQSESLNAAVAASIALYAYPHGL